MFTVLYRWKIKPELEDQFIKAWSEVLEYYVKNFDSLGSRLHRGTDGIYYSYAQWKSAEHREKAFSERIEMSARDKMREAIDKTFEAVELEVLSDFLKVGQ